MAYFEPGIYVDTFDPDADGFIRARGEDAYCHVDVGQLVSVDSEDLSTYARVVKFEGDPETGFILLKEVTGTEWEQASAEHALAYDGWCDPLDE